MTLLLGGVRSGKSARAVALAREAADADGRVLFVATAEALDDDMRRRIALHRAERPAGWETVEAPLGVPAAVGRALGAVRAAPNERCYSAVVLDCVTLWAGNVLLALGELDDAEAAMAARVDALLAVRAEHAAAAGRWVVVSNEVGLGVVPPTALGRRYRDMLGRANQRLAAAADVVTLMVAGIEVRVKGSA